MGVHVQRQHLTVLVASTNPVKIRAAAAGFGRMLPHADCVVDGREADSGVSDQPMSDEITRRGAENRASHIRALFSECDYAVGVEGGIEVIGGQMFAFAWVVIDGREQIGCSRSGSFLLPPRVQQLVEAGQELGHANDEVFAQHNSKQQGGAVGLLTGGVIDRCQLYQHAVELALIPFRDETLFAEP